MKMKSCKNGHYYNEDKEDKCPYCSDSNNILGNIGNEENGKRKLNDVKNNEYENTKILNSNQEEKIEEELFKEGEATVMLDTRTYSSTKEIEILSAVELAGWIVIISNKGKGRVYNITYGMNTIGRSQSNQISIDNGDSSISREKHASIIYDFENNIFFIQHHDGKYLTYLNKKMVLNSTELHAYDKIKMGKTEFIFVPLCGDNFKWEDNEN